MKKSTAFHQGFQGMDYVYILPVQIIFCLRVDTCSLTFQIKCHSRKSENEGLILHISWSVKVTLSHPMTGAHYGDIPRWWPAHPLRLELQLQELWEEPRCRAGVLIIQQFPHLNAASRLAHDRGFVPQEHEPWGSDYSCENTCIHK